MLKAEIKVGQSYYVNGFSMGRAVVISEPEPHPWRGRKFEVQVEYPDSQLDDEGNHRKSKVATSDITRIWSNEDQKEFEIYKERLEDQRGWTEELHLAGFDGNLRIHSDNSMHLSFQGRAAELVLEKLTGIEIPEEKKLGAIDV